MASILMSGKVLMEDGLSFYLDEMREGKRELSHTSVPLIHPTQNSTPYKFVVDFSKIIVTILIWSFLKLMWFQINFKK
jgi:hypothetical protein